MNELYFSKILGYETFSISLNIFKSVIQSKDFFKSWDGIRKIRLNFILKPGVGWDSFSRHNISLNLKNISKILGWDSFWNLYENSNRT